MAGIAVLVFREVLEAALIVSVVFAATRGVPSRTRWVGAGILAGVLGAVGVALSAGLIADAAAGMGPELFNATVLFAAVAMIAWHAIWMATHGREMAMQMQTLGAEVSVGQRPLAALLIVVALAVLREGSEVWDSSRVLSDRSILGQTLHALVGYDARPAGIQVLFYIVTGALIAVGMKLWGRPTKGATGKGAPRAA